MISKPTPITDVRLVVGLLGLSITIGLLGRSISNPSVVSPIFKLECLCSFHSAHSTLGLGYGHMGHFYAPPPLPPHLPFLFRPLFPLGVARSGFRPIFLGTEPNRFLKISVRFLPPQLLEPVGNRTVRFRSVFGRFLGSFADIDNGFLLSQPHTLQSSLLSSPILCLPSSSPLLTREEESRSTGRREQIHRSACISTASSLQQKPSPTIPPHPTPPQTTTTTKTRQNKTSSFTIHNLPETKPKSFAGEERWGDWRSFWIEEGRWRQKPEREDGGYGYRPLGKSFADPLKNRRALPICRKILEEREGDEGEPEKRDREIGEASGSRRGRGGRNQRGKMAVVVAARRGGGGRNQRGEDGGYGYRTTGLWGESGRESQKGKREPERKREERARKEEGRNRVGEETEEKWKIRRRNRGGSRKLIKVKKPRCWQKKVAEN